MPPCDSECTAGVIFFNNVGYLGMCGHGMIGVVETLRFLGRLGPGLHKFETVAGIVTTHVLDDGRVEIGNVAELSKPCPSGLGDGELRHRQSGYRIRRELVLSCEIGIDERSGSRQNGICSSFLMS